MADLNLTARPINAGDPVTSDAINNIIADLNLINKGTTISNIILTNAAGTNVSVSSKVYSTTISKVLVNPAKTPSGKGSLDISIKSIY